MDELLGDFTAHINAVHPAIRFMREEEEDGRLAVLDARISREDRSLTFSVYRKPTHTDQYLQFYSNQPLQHKLGVIKMLAHRCATICKDRESRTQETRHVKKVLTSKCLREDLEGGNWIVPEDTLFRPSLIWIGHKRECCHPICGPGFRADSSPFPQ